MSNSKRILAALLAGAMVLCAGCGKEEETEEESSNSTAVEVTDVTSGAMSSEYTLNGKIAAVNEVQETEVAARIDLLTAYNTYQWAKRGVITATT